MGNSFDAMDDTQLYSAKEKRQPTQIKLSQSVSRVTQPVRRGVDAAKRRGRAGVDAVRNKSSRGVEKLRARSKSVPRVRRSTFQVSKVMRDKPLPNSIFGRKKEKKEKCQEDWRNTKAANESEKRKKKDEDGLHTSRSSSGGDQRDRHENDENEFTRTRSSGSRKCLGEEYAVDFSRTRSSESNRSRR